MSTGNRILLRLEGAAVLIGSVWAYGHLDHWWGWFALLFLAPDVGMIGYLVNTRWGAVCYNLFHTYLGPLGLVGLAWQLGSTWGLAIGLVWSAHIGFDRLLGYGLKQASGFDRTHLSP